MTTSKNAGAHIRMKSIQAAILGLIVGIGMAYAIARTFDWVSNPGEIPHASDPSSIPTAFMGESEAFNYPSTDGEYQHEERADILIKGMELVNSYDLKRHYDEEFNEMEEHSIITPMGHRVEVWRTFGYPSYCAIKVANHKQAIPWIKWLRERGVTYDLVPSENGMDSYTINIVGNILPGWIDSYIEFPSPHYPSLNKGNDDLTLTTP